MRTRSILIAIAILSVGPVLAQRGMGRGAGPAAGGTVPNAGAQRGSAAGQAAKATAAQTAHVPQPNTAIAHLQQHPALAARLAPLLPAGMTAEQAADGFKNWGQFVAALNVCKNLNLPFADMKTWMTGSKPLSLGKAIQALRPTLPEDQVRESVRTAEREARELDRQANKETPTAPAPKA